MAFKLSWAINAFSEDLRSPVGTRGKLSESILPSFMDSG